jgi:hypothetical protein
LILRKDKQDSQTCDKTNKRDGEKTKINIPRGGKGASTIKTPMKFRGLLGNTSKA